MNHEPLIYRYDPAADILVVNDMAYSGALFRSFAVAKPGTWMKVVFRASGPFGEYLGVFMPGEEQQNQINSIVPVDFGLPEEQDPHITSSGLES